MPTDRERFVVYYQCSDCGKSIPLSREESALQDRNPFGFLCEPCRAPILRRIAEADELLRSLPEEPE